MPYTVEQKIKQYDFLCIDAPDKVTHNESTYVNTVFERSVKKIYVGLRALQENYKTKKIIKFIWGNFGSGTFGNNATLMYSTFLFCLSISRV